jgi:ADP-heptose:LPS heptosyltransferase
LPPTVNNQKGKRLFFLSKSKQLISHFNIHSTPKKNEVYESRFVHKLIQNFEFVRYFENWGTETILKKVKQYYFLANTPAHQPVEGKYFIIHPGSGKLESHKRYPPKLWEIFIKEIRKVYPSVKIIICGTGDEALLVESITTSFSLDKKVLNASNKYSLSEYLALINNCTLFISGDCGPTHMASILRKPMVTIFGPTDYAKTGPFSNCVPVFCSPKLKCMPCYGSLAFGIKGCPTVDCMNNVTSSQVLAAIVLQLNKPHETA